MKKIFFISIVLIQISFLSTFYSLAQDFAPLNLGNVWVWKHVEWGTIEKSTVVDTSILINKNYFYKIRVYEGSNMFNYSRFNFDDSLFYLYQSNYPYNDGEYPYYKLNCALGDTFSFPISQYANVTVAVIDTYLAQVFDTILTVKILHRNAGGLVEHYEAWTDEIGLLSNIEHPWGTVYFILKGCIINGIVYGDTAMTVSVEDEHFTEFNFKLHQNYPNPFNPNTSIQYDIKERGFVELKVYDILGKEVAVLVNEVKDEGFYKAVFNADELPSGVYIYSLRVNDFVQNNKMILLK